MLTRAKQWGGRRLLLLAAWLVDRAGGVLGAQALFAFAEELLDHSAELLGKQATYAVRDCYVQRRKPDEEPFRANRLGWALANLERYVVIPRETMLNPGRRMTVIRDLAFPNVNGIHAEPYRKGAGMDALQLGPDAQAFVDELARLAREERAAMTRLEAKWPAWFKRAETFSTKAAVKGGKFGRPE